MLFPKSCKLSHEDSTTCSHHTGDASFKAFSVLCEGLKQAAKDPDACGHISETLLNHLSSLLSAKVILHTGMSKKFTNEHASVYLCCFCK